jgi:hypothetical protein
MRPLLGVRLTAFSMGLPMPFGGFPGTRASALKGARPGAHGALAMGRVPVRWLGRQPAQEATERQLVEHRGRTGCASFVTHPCACSCIVLHEPLPSRVHGNEAKTLELVGWEMVLPDRIELSTSPLPRECSTTELRQHGASADAGAYCHTRPWGSSAAAASQCQAPALGSRR